MIPMFNEKRRRMLSICILRRFFLYGHSHVAAVAAEMCLEDVIHSMSSIIVLSLSYTLFAFLTKNGL